MANCLVLFENLSLKDFKSIDVVFLLDAHASASLVARLVADALAQCRAEAPRLALRWRVQSVSASASRHSALDALLPAREFVSPLRRAAWRALAGALAGSGAHPQRRATTAAMSSAVAARSDASASVVDTTVTLTAALAALARALLSAGGDEQAADGEADSSTATAGAAADDPLTRAICNSNAAQSARAAAAAGTTRTTADAPTSRLLLLVPLLRLPAVGASRAALRAFLGTSCADDAAQVREAVSLAFASALPALADLCVRYRRAHTTSVRWLAADDVHAELRDPLVAALASSALGGGSAVRSSFRDKVDAACAAVAPLFGVGAGDGTAAATSDSGAARLVVAAAAASQGAERDSDAALVLQRVLELDTRLALPAGADEAGGDAALAVGAALALGTLPSADCAALIGPDCVSHSVGAATPSSATLAPLLASLATTDRTLLLASGAAHSPALLMTATDGGGCGALHVPRASAVDAHARVAAALRAARSRVDGLVALPLVAGAPDVAAAAPPPPLLLAAEPDAAMAAVLANRPTLVLPALERTAARESAATRTPDAKRARTESARSPFERDVTSPEPATSLRDTALPLPPACASGDAAAHYQRLYGMTLCSAASGDLAHAVRSLVRGIARDRAVGADVRAFVESALLRSASALRSAHSSGQSALPHGFEHLDAGAPLPHVCWREYQMQILLRFELALLAPAGGTVTDPIAAPLLESIRRLLSHW